MEENKSSVTPVIWIIVAIALLCCCCAALLGIGGYAYYNVKDRVGTALPTVFEITSEPIFNDPTATPAAPAQLTRVPVSEISTDTVKTLEESIVPVNDLRDLACRLRAKCSIPEVVPSGPFKNGDKQKIWVQNTDTAKNFQVDATLKYLTAHAYFWVQDGVDFNEAEAKDLVDAFETKIYPTDREFFGSEWSPGVDNDPHVYLVYARGIGGSVAGYFSSPDEYAPDAHEASNAHEMFVFNADNSPLREQYTYGVLAHEFQHMIHWKQDRNET